MIFKQRLFTILLGLLFATALTDQASALYDPGVGRFCSRDPMIYLGAILLYDFVNSRFLTLVDPNGLRPFAMIQPHQGPMQVSPASPVPQPPPPDAPDFLCENSTATETTVNVCIRPVRSKLNPGDVFGACLFTY